MNKNTTRGELTLTVKDKIENLQGPILVLGASGFIGANLFRTLLSIRNDVYGTASRLPAWRLRNVRRENTLVTDLLIDSNLDTMLEHIKPRTIFDCVAYGAYSFETNKFQSGLTPFQSSRTSETFMLYPCGELV
jgi:hypothetical protein